MTTCLKAFEIFKSSNIHMAVIVDEYGSTEGIVTSADLLEAVIGILPSNYDDVEDIAIRERDDGSWLIDGRTPIHEMQLTFGLDQLSTDDGYETIAGFLVQQLRKNPVEGDKFESFGYVFEVIDMDGRRIDKILMARARSGRSSSDAA
jgi:putative hemolysin